LDAALSSFPFSVFFDATYGGNGLVEAHIEKTTFYRDGVTEDCSHAFLSSSFPAAESKVIAGIISPPL
jgi:hypothetical protein